MRGLLRIIRPHLGPQFSLENAFYRDLSRQLSFVRDTQALLEALDRLVAGAANSPPNLSLIREHLVQERDSAGGGEAQLVEHLEAIVAPLEAAAARALTWQVPDQGFDTFAAGLSKTYHRARRALKRVHETPTAETLHEWRKRVKYHWHHTLILRRICPRFMKPHRKLAESLGELLGQDHDYAVLREHLSDLSGSTEFLSQKRQLFTEIDEQRTALRTTMVKLGGYLQAETPKQLAARWHAYWQTWRQEA
jgi:CHAD domain-containing protein